MTKKKATQSFTTDDYGFGSEFDFPEFDFEPVPVKTKREAISRIAVGTKEGLISSIKSPSFFQSLIKTALPKGYGQALDLADQSASTLRDLYNDGVREVKPALQDLARTTDKLMPSAEKYLPKSATEALKRFSEKHREQSNSGLSSTNANETALRLLLADVFKGTMQADLGREARGNVKEQLNNTMTQERHRDQLAQLDGIRTGVSQIAAYQRKVEFGFHKKSLELQARSYFVQVAQLEEQKRQNAFNRSHLAGILNNTSLPDYVKMKTSEQFSMMTRNKFMESLSDGIFSKRMSFVNNIGKAFKEQVQSGLRAGVEGLRTGLGAAEMAAEGDEVAEQFGIDKWRNGGKMLGGITSNIVGSLIGDRVKRRVEGNGTGMKKIRKFGNRLQSGLDQLPQHASEFSNSVEDASDYAERALDKTNLSDKWKRRLTGVAGMVGNPLMDFARGTIKRADSYDGHLKEGNISGLTAPAVFNNQASKSITEIIPGYLARIHQELQILRTGDASVDMVEYNHDRGAFDTARGVRKTIFNKLVNKDTKDSLRRESNSLLDSIDSEGKLSPAQRKLLSNKFLKDNMSNTAGTLSRYANSYNYTSVEKKHAKSLAAFFKALEASDDEGAKQVAFGQRFNRIGEGIGDQRGMIQNYADTHHTDALREMGVLKEGSSRINMEALYGYHGGDRYSPQGRLAGGRVSTQTRLGANGLPAAIPNSSAGNVDINPLNLPSIHQGQDVTPVVDTLHAMRELMVQQNMKPIVQSISETLLVIQRRLEDGILTQNMPEGFPIVNDGNGSPRRRGMLNRMNIRLSDAAKGIFRGAKWGVQKAAGLGNSLVGGGLSAVTTIATGGLNLAGRAAMKIGTGAYRRTMGFLDVYVGNETTPRMYARKVQEGAYFDTVTRKVIKRFSDITDNGVSDASGVILAPEDVNAAYVKEGPVKKSLKAVGAVFKFGSGISKKIGGAILSGMPLVYGAALWAGKKALGLLYLAQDVFVKDKLDNPILTARTMRAGGYRSRINGHVIKHPGQIDGPVIDDMDETLLTNEDIAKGLVDKHNKPLKTGLMKLIGTFTGALGASVGAAKKVGTAVWKMAKASFKNSTRFAKALGKGAIDVGGFVLDRARGRPTFGAGQGASEESTGLLIQTGMESKDVLIAIYDVLNDRLPAHKKRVEGDVDGDGIRDGSYADLMRKRKATKEAEQVNAAPSTGVRAKAGGMGLLGGAKSLWNKLRGRSDDDDDGLDLDGGGDARAAKRARRLERQRPGFKQTKGLWNKTKWLGKAGGRLLGKGVGLAAGLLTGGIGLGSLTGAGSAIATGAGAVASGISAGASALATGATALGSAILSVVGAPVLIAAGAVALLGVGAYLGYKYFTKKRLGIVSTVRYVQYGFDPADKDHLQAVFGLEDKLKAAVVYGKDGASLDESKVDTKKLMDDFDVNAKDEGEVQRWLAWFGQRFKPVFLTHVTALKGAVGGKWLDDVDGLDVVVMRKYFNASKFLEGPYGVFTSPFKNLKYLVSGSEDVKNAIAKAEADLVKKEKETSAKAGGAVAAVAGAAAVKIADKTTTPQGNTAVDPNATKLGGANPAMLVSVAEQNITTGLGNQRAQTTVTGSSVILESLGTNRLDAIAAIRMKAYGLVKMESDKVKALFTLEKQIEKELTWTNKIASWSGSLEQLLRNAGAAFGVDSTDEERGKAWLLWFNQRFLPVFLNYATSIYAQTGKYDLAIGSDSLKPSQLLEVGTAIAVASRGAGSIWTVTNSPWPGYLLNTDVRSVEGNMQALREMSKNAVLSQVGSRPSDLNGQAANAPAASKDKAQQEKVKESGSWFSNVGSKVSSWFGGGKTSTTGLTAPNTADTSMGGGQAITQPGKGTGGDINKLPLPKGNKSYAALKDLIAAASQMVGVDPRLMSVMAAIESGFDTAARAATSSASGLYQFIDGTWQSMLKKFGSKYGIDPTTKQTDPRANALMGAEYIKENAAYLGKKLNRPLTDTDLYFAHFLGSSGAEKLLNADPSAIAATLLPEAARANKSIFYSPDGSPLTVAQVYTLVNGRVKNKGKNFGIADGGEALVSSTPTAPVATGPTPPATTAVASDPVAPKVATQNGIGTKVTPAPADAPSTTQAPKISSGPTNSVSDGSKVDMNAMYGGFMAPQALNRDLAAQSKYQNEVRVLALDDTNIILQQSLEVQTASYKALTLIAEQMAGAAAKMPAPTSVDAAPAAQAPDVRNLRGSSKPMARSPISLAKPIG